MLAKEGPASSSSGIDKIMVDFLQKKDFILRCLQEAPSPPVSQEARSPPVSKWQHC